MLKTNQTEHAIDDGQGHACCQVHRAAHPLFFHWMAAFGNKSSRDTVDLKETIEEPEKRL